MNITRFAPSPTGRLHLGHAYSAVLGRHRGEQFRLRIEDLDQTRSRAEFIEGIYQDLKWLGIAWNGEVLIQSRRAHDYSRALNDLRARGLVYPCFCTRADIGAALEAPHGPTGVHYPGTCRGLADDPDRRASQPHSWRLDAGKALDVAGLPSWSEGGRNFDSSRDDIDDAILARKDAAAAYHLACVVDDAASGVTLVVRGADLRASTPIQRLLQDLLYLPEPRYLHHRLVAHADGRRLAKRDLAPTLVAMREAAIDGESLARDLRAGKLPLGFGFADA